MSKRPAIAISTDLERAVREYLDTLRLPGVRLTVQIPAPTDAVDLWLRAEIDEREVLFGVECKLNPAARDIDLARQNAGTAAPLLAAPHLPEPLVERCREAGISCLDLNGRLYLRQPGLLVDWQRKQKRFRSAEPERALFAGKSSRLARALLSFPGREWKQHELAKFTGCSTGLISRLVREYARLGWVEGSWGDWTLVKPHALLDAWAAADSWRKRGTLRQYSSLLREPDELAAEFLRQSNEPVAFTQWFAAAHRHPYTELPVVSAYRPHFPQPDEIAALNLREVPNGGRLWIIVPRDEGVFQATRILNGFPLACDAQIYLDLLQVGLRGPDAAKALRQWEGFCK